MKLQTRLALGALAALAFTRLAAAEPIAQLHPTGYVNDFANVLDANTIAQLDNVCQQIDQKAQAQIAVVTIKSLDGDSIEDYAVNLFKTWGVGEKSTNRGVLILLAVQDHQYRIEVGYGLEPILPDGEVGGFGREAVPLLKQDDYNGAVSLMTQRVAEVIAQDAGVQLTGGQPLAAPTPQDRPSPGLPISGIVFLVVFIGLIVLANRFGSGRRGLGGWVGGGWGIGGGGFGGGGGGFGGFGGGMSGGGGASGSW